MEHTLAVRVRDGSADLQKRLQQLRERPFVGGRLSGELG